jgi:lipid-binding SYLF domain-containing protein
LTPVSLHSRIARDSAIALSFAHVERLNFRNKVEEVATMMRLQRRIFSRAFVLLAFCVVVVPLFGQKDEEKRLANSADVLQQILSQENGLPKAVLDKAYCVLIFPGVKKVAIGIGGSYGRGALVCRKGAKMDDSWGAPAMYALDQGSLGVQLGSTETDFVGAITSQKGVDEILNGKTKLGSNAAVAAGPTGAQAASYSAVGNADILTYSRSKGLFAGVSLAGASVDIDKDTNKAIYGKEEGAKDIIQGNQAIVPAAKPLVDLLDKTSPARK